MILKDTSVVKFLPQLVAVFANYKTAPFSCDNSSCLLIRQQLKSDMIFPLFILSQIPD